MEVDVPARQNADNGTIHKGTNLSQDDMQAQAVICHKAAADVLLPVGHLIDVIFFIAPVRMLLTAAGSQHALSY